MKKYCKFIIFCVLIFSLIFLSCNNILLSKGSSLSIRLPGTEQSRFAFVKPENLDSFTIILTKKNGKTQEKTAKAGETIVFDSLTADTYTVSAKAFDEDNNCAAYAQEEVLIKPKQNTNLVLNLTWNLLTQAAIDNDEVDFVVTPPKKTTYTLGEDFDPTGLKVEAVLKNGYRQEIPALIQSDTGPSQPIYYYLQPGSESQITATTAYEIYVSTNESLSGVHIYGFAGFIPLTLNVPKPVITTEPESIEVNTSNAGSTNTCTLFVVEPYYNQVGYDVKYQWYRVENGKAKILEDNSNTNNPEYPYYRGTTQSSLTITFDTDDTNTYQYYCEVTYSISDQPTADPLPGITYGKTTATTKSKIVTVTTKGSSSGSAAVPTVPSSNYQIGDVYPPTGTPMGVVFEVAADYIKIVALQDLNAYTGLVTASWIFTEDSEYIKAMMDENDGSVNMEAYRTWYDYMSAAYTDFSDELSFYQVKKYSVINESENWYIPAKNELITICKDEDGKIAPVLSQYDGGELTTSLTYWSSTFDSTNFKKAYTYTTFSGDDSAKSVETSCYVRPVMKIAL